MSFLNSLEKTKLWVLQIEGGINSKKLTTEKKNNNKTKIKVGPTVFQDIKTAKCNFQKWNNQGSPDQPKVTPVKRIKNKK